MTRKVHHSALKIYDTDDHDVLTGDERRRALREFQLTGAMYGAFFAPVGGDWEEDDDPSTWGPESPDAVDWEGFEGDQPEGG